MKFKDVNITLRRKYLWFLGIIAAVIVLIIVIIGIKMAVSPMLSDVVKLPFNDSQQYCFTGTGFLYIDNNYVRYLDLDGSGYPAILNNTDVKITGSGKKMHVVYDDTSISIIGNKEAVLVDGKIESVKCCDDYAACLVIKDGKERIEVYDIKGKLLETIETDMELSDFGFSGVKRQLLYTVTIELATENFVSTITTYEPSQGATTGVITVQNQLIEKIVFGEKSIFVKGTENIIRFDAATNKEAYRLIANGYEMLDCFSDINTYMILRSENENNNMLTMYRASQTNVSDMRILPLYKLSNDLATFVYGDYIYSFTENKLNRYSLKGKICEQEKIGFNATEVIRLKDDYVLIKSNNSLYSAKINKSNLVKQTFSK